MPIAFQCPGCKKAYRLKDELAGKKVTCAEPKCRKQFTVPTPIAAPAGPAPKSQAEAEALAAAALAEDAAAAAAPVDAAPEGAPIKAVCRFCDFENVFEARLAGKNAPCQNDDCRKIIKVPLPEQKGPRDWRQVGKQLPSLARRDTEQMEGAWGNVETAAVSQEALVSARATQRDEEEPASWGRRLRWIAAAIVAIGVLGYGVVFALRKYDDYRAGRAMHMAMTFEYRDSKTGKTKPLDKPEKGVIRYLAAIQDIDQGRAKDAKNHLEEARGGLEPVNSYERAALLIEIASMMAELTGTRAESDEGKRIEWDREKLSGSVRATLAKLPIGSVEDGRDLRAHACRVLTRRLAQRDQIAGAISLAKHIAGPDEQAEILAVAGLELLGLGQREKAEELAMTATTMAAKEFAPSLIALWMALGASDAAPEKQSLAANKARSLAPMPGKEPNVSFMARVGYAEGLARQGKLPEARGLAWRVGKAEERLRAGAAVAVVAVEVAKSSEHVDLEACAKLLEQEFGKDKAAPPWLVHRLALTAVRAGRADLAQKFADAIKDSGLKAWSQYEILRARLESGAEPADFASVETIGDSDKLAQMLAVAAVARSRAKAGSRGDVFKEIKNWPNEREKMKAFGFAGMALASCEVW